MQNSFREVAKHYGEKCAFCGEDDVTVLSIYPPGSHGVRQHLYALRAAGYPEQDEYGRPYRILCQNCITRQRIEDRRM